MNSIDIVLEQLGIRESLSGDQVGADDVFMDWVVASYLQDDSIGDGRFTYSNYPAAPQPSDTETIEDCPMGDLTRDVRQYGVDYIRITCPGVTASTSKLHCCRRGSCRPAFRFLRFLVNKGDKVGYDPYPDLRFYRPVGAISFRSGRGTTWRKITITCTWKPPGRRVWEILRTPPER
jgi:hypothetical protein